MKISSAIRNSVRIIARILGLFLLAISYLFPRNKKIWALGSNMGFSNNAKFFYIYLSKYEDLRPIWIGNKEEVQQVRLMNMEAYEQLSLKGLYYSLVAGVYLYNSYVSDINLFTFGRAIKINLWHGVGLKKCERLITKGPVAKIFNTRNPLLKLNYLHFFIQPDFLLSTSQVMSDYQASCFGLPLEKVIKNMYPRCEVFFKDKELVKTVKEMANASSKSLIELCQSSKYTYLYMPTWRDSNFDFFADFDFKKINDILKRRGEYMLLKLHPASRLNITIKECTNIVHIDKYADIYEVIGYTDCLITDFSSIYYDYILMRGKRVILYIPDYKHYLSEDRDLAFDYMESTVGEFAYKFDELLELIDERIEGTYIYEGMDSIINRFWGKTLETDCHDLYKKICELIDLE